MHKSAILDTPCELITEHTNTSASLIIVTVRLRTCYSKTPDICEAVNGKAERDLDFIRPIH